MGTEEIVNFMWSFLLKMLTSFYNADFERSENICSGLNYDAISSIFSKLKNFLNQKNHMFCHKK